MNRLPAITLIATPGRLRQALETAQQAERRGFTGVYIPSFLDNMGFCEALALTTTDLRFGTSIANIYTRHPVDFAQSAALIHELSNGRFVFGVGVSHGPTHRMLGINPGRPLAEMRHFVETVRSTGGGPGSPGALPPIVLATLRQKMVELASEVGDGAVWANASRSAMPASLTHLTDDQRTNDAYFIGNMIPTCISDDHEAAAAVMRRTLTGYVSLPNYQNYWIEAGYGDMIAAIRAAIAAGDRGRVTELMADDWLHDVTLFGTAAEVRDGLDAWFAAGVKTPILVPSSTSGGQFKAVEELFAAFA